MDDMLARLNRIYPNSSYVLIPKYVEEQWKAREYDSQFDNKSALTKWKSKPLNYEDAQEAVEKGYRIGWVVPGNMCVVDVDNKDHPESQKKIEAILKKFEVKYSYNKTFRGMHFVFQDSSGMIKSDSHCKCGLNIDVDTRANKTGYIILPCNDPHRKWGQWNDYVEEIPYFLKPLMRDTTPSFIGMIDGDGRNSALYKWRSKIVQTHKLTDKQVENTIRTINEYLFAVPMQNSELFKTVLREQEEERNSDQVTKSNAYNNIAEQIISRCDIISFGDQFYRFNGNYYKPVSNLEVERIVHYDISQNISSTGRKEVLQFLRLKTQVEPEDFDKDWYKIAVKNGVLNIVTGELSEPLKTEYNTIYIPWNYNDDPVYSPRIDQFMKDIANGDPIKMMFLYQIVGYCLLKQNIFQKFFIFQGEGGTGKSTFLSIIAKLLGDDKNVSHVGLNCMDKDYYLAKMMGKLANIDDDVVDGKVLEDTGRFKSLTSGQAISVRQIYQEPIDWKSYTTCIFSCNKLPRIMDKTSGLYRRMILLELNHKVANPDPLFFLKLTDADMEYFLFKSVEAIKIAMEEGHFRITISEQELLRKFRCRQSALNEWIYDQEYTLGDFIDRPCSQMYKIFIQWCNDYGYTKLPTLFTFREDICSLFDMQTEYIEEGTARIQKFIKRGTNINLTLKPF